MENRKHELKIMRVEKWSIENDDGKVNLMNAQYLTE